MVMKTSMLLTAVCVALTMSAATAQARVKPRTVTRVLIQEVGKSDDEDLREGCKTFRVSRNDVARFFLKAYPVPAKIGAHDRYSPCHAKGVVEFSDNTRGHWKISSGGTGTLYWDTGDVVTLFYPGYTWRDPFECTYGLSDKGEC